MTSPKEAIDEITRLRRVLERDIQNLLDVFESTTGLCVMDVDVQRMQTASDLRKTVLTGISVAVEFPNA